MEMRPTAAHDTAFGERVRPLSPALGIEVRGLDLAAPLDADTVRTIRGLLYQHCVLLVRGQRIDEEQQVRFGEYFGHLANTLGKYAINRTTHPAIMYVTNEKENGQYVGALPDGEMYFHSDRCYVARPCLATMLYAIDIPSVGGNTLFANQYRAYETLSDGMKQLLEGLRYISSSAKADVSRTREDRIKDSKRDDAKTLYEATHPVVRTHPETGRKALYVNTAHALRFENMTVEESAPLLDYLCQHSIRPEFTCRFRWSPGALALWDNRCTLHNPVNDYHGQLRSMHRITLAGDRPT